MSFLNDFEDRISSVFGAAPQGYTEPFSFKKLAKRAAREMENETYEIDGVDTAPALYTVLVSSSDDSLMRPLYEQITQETAGFVASEAKRKGYAFVGEPLVRFMVDPSLKSGKFAVFAENVDAGTLARLREEERAFLGGNSSMGGAAALVQKPYTGHDSQGARRGGRLTPIPEQGAQPAAPDDSAIAGLDVMPAEYGSYPMDDPIMVASSPSSSTPMPVPVMAQPGAEPLAPQPVPVDMPPVSQARPSHMRPAQRAAARPAPQTQPPAQPAPAAPAAPAAPEPQPAAPQAPAPQPVAAAPSRQAATPSCLLIDRTTGRTYMAQAPAAILGRERSQCDVVLRDPNVSRRHAELSYDGHDWHIVDLRSTNGTLVNDIDVDECVLRDGDLITVGLVNLEFRENQQ